jgi:hypothetical protein
MNRHLWENAKLFRLDSIPAFECPKCYQGILILKNRAEQLTSRGEEEDKHGSQGVEGICNLFFKCSNIACNETFAGLGLIYNIELYDAESGHEEYSQFTPNYFFPNLRPFQLYESIPKSIRTQIDLSFSHFFSDTSSAANRVRNAVELIMEAVIAPKSKLEPLKSKCPIRDEKCSSHRIKGEMKETRFTTLGQRLENYSNKDVGKLLKANTIIGNEGSHEGNEVTLENLLDSYKILERVLDILFVKSHEQTDAIAQKIIDSKRKGKK